MRLKGIKAAIFGSVCLLTVCALLPKTKPIIDQSRVTYIIDAGHGLPDGGAIGVDGSTEQELNLSVAKKLHAKFPKGTAVMVREGEDSLALSEGSIREKKVEDMRQRVKFCDGYPQATLISIHMNTYPNASVYGCQIFYRSGNERSEQIAKRLQQDINTHLQPDHTKNAKPIPESLYLFQNTDNAAILIECGFVTNPDELEKLKNEGYQQKLADLIYTSLA